ncbi:MAG TPA: methyltransferase domain-containing protein [Ktedonobacteraceae bacterium]|jgi:ubiquinone/menaquinone biosynthesis C-methylase UbiE|nr:methyltransferase domain-containing protein [Ktedonobacteraceae bacterium]
MAEENNEKNTYVMDPESAAEMARLIDQDLTLTREMGELFPQSIVLKDGNSVLDVACGPGGWALEVAYEYPEVQVVGVDISQPMISYANMRAKTQRLTNAQFQVANVLEPLPFADNTFDLVNARLMTSFLPRDAWPHVVRELVRITRPGGAVIHTECDVFGESNSSSLEALTKAVHEAMHFAGLYVGKGSGVTSRLPGFLQEAGCTDIQQKTHVVNFSAGTPSHRPVLENFRVGVQLIRPFVTRRSLLTAEKFDELRDRALEETQSEQFRGTWTFVTVWGTKQ